MHTLRLCVLSALLASTGLAQNTWRVPGNFATIQDAIDSSSVLGGDTILVGPGNHAGALVDKWVVIQGTGGAVIDDGPAHPAGLSQGFRLLTGADGTTISHLTFTTDLSIMNGEAVDNVTVTQCTFKNVIQAISNWRGSWWEISFNTITNLRTRCGGGIGILVGDYSGGCVQDNVISHNRIYGTLHVSSGDCGGYNGTGIVLYADFRWSRLGASEISGNQVVQNHVALTSDTPGLVDVVAFEMTDTRDDDLADPVIFCNYIGFNDWRGTVLQEALTPLNLSIYNNLSRNLGNNRGHGLPPAIFGPGGN